MIYHDDDQGLHLHNILVVDVFLANSDINHKFYLLIGWDGGDDENDYF